MPTHKQADHIAKSFFHPFDLTDRERKRPIQLFKGRNVRCSGRRQAQTTQTPATYVNMKQGAVSIKVLSASSSRRK